MSWRWLLSILSQCGAPPKKNLQPIVFGYLAEASAGACDLIKSVADELAPRYADLYLLESVEAAVGIAPDRLREELGAAVSRRVFCFVGRPPSRALFYGFSS